MKFRTPPVPSTLAAVAVTGISLFGGGVSAAAQVKRPPQSPITVRWTPAQTKAFSIAVEVAGLSASTLRQLRNAKWEVARWQELLSVYAEQEPQPPAERAGSSPGQAVPPMVGRYSVRANLLRFEPQYPIEPGIAYHAVFRPDRLPGTNRAAGPPITARFRLPPGIAESRSQVSYVYPSADVLPENLLKFYVHFSAPMSRGRIYDHIHLRRENGEEIELPFLEIDEELWDSQFTRLTLFIDPGRIKRGVLPLEEVGPALEAGQRYALVIDRDMRDGAGNPLREGFQKVFAVGPPDREPPDPARWKIIPPAPGTRNPVELIFPEPMDEALSRRMIRVIGITGEFVTGETSLEGNERRWIFWPREQWQRGRHRLVVETTIEDLAGNNIGKPFDVDVFEKVQKKLTSRTVEVAFEVR